jgi:hypothetical protein
MALSPPSQFSGYAPGSIAARPTVQKGGMRGKNEDPADFRNRMDARKPMAIAPGGQSRQDRVIASRMDGTFDTKRNTFNAANANVQMDEAGNIGPRAATPSPVNPVPPVNTVTPPVTPPAPAPAAPKPPAGGTPPLMKPVGKIDGQPASLVLEGMKAAPQAQRPAIAANPTARRSPGGGFVMPPQAQRPAVTPPNVTAGVTPPVTRNAPVTPSVTPRAVTPLSPTENQQFTALGQAMQLSQASQGPMPRAVAPAAVSPPMAGNPTGFSPEFQRRFTPTVSTPPPASPAVAAPTAPRAVAPPRRLDAAQAQAVKNPQGLSARLNPPGLPPKTLSQDPIAKPFVAAGKAIKGGIQSQAARNPQGLAARLGRLTGVVPPSAMLGR